MKINKNQLEEIIKEEIVNALNEISPKTKFLSGGFKGIEKMALQAEWALDNLEQKFDDPPEEIYIIQKFLESIKKAAMWQLGSNEMMYALHSMSESERDKHFKRSHTPAYKRDAK